MVAEGLEKYEQSYAIYPSPNTLLNIALNEQLLGKTLKALRHFREAIRNPLLSAAGVEFGKKYVAELEPSFARLDLTGPTGLVVALGKEDIMLPLLEPLDIEPGQVTATGVQLGRRYEASGKAAAGKILSIEMKAPGAVTSKTEEMRGRDSTRYAVSGSLVALGIVGVGLGIGFTAAANHQSNQVATYSTGSTFGCTVASNGNCAPLSNSAQARTRDSNIAVGSYIGGGVLIAAGVATYFVWPKLIKERSASVAPWIGKDGAGLAYGKEF